MCGIVGIIDPSGAPIDRALLGRMTDRLTPRGPDGEGFWAAPGVGLGHRRLSVVDLTEAAAQPMTSRNGQIRLVFNGEIYNHPELRAELTACGHTFTSRADSEVIVHG